MQINIEKTKLTMHKTADDSFLTNFIVTKQTFAFILLFVYN